MKKILIGLAAAGLIASPYIAKQAGYRINLTDSAPLGLWEVHPVKDPRRGALVSVCPPKTPVVTAMAKGGHIPYGDDCPDTETVTLLKAIGALPGDVVTVRGNRNILVNGKEIPNTAPKFAHMAVKDGEYRVNLGQAWVFSTYIKNSFDSRYFGPVKLSGVRAAASPLYVNGNAADMHRGIN